MVELAISNTLVNSGWLQLAQQVHWDPQIIHHTIAATQRLWNPCRIHHHRYKYPKLNIAIQFNFKRILTFTSFLHTTLRVARHGWVCWTPRWLVGWLVGHRWWWPCICSALHYALMNHATGPLTRPISKLKSAINFFDKVCVMRWAHPFGWSLKQCIGAGFQPLAAGMYWDTALNQKRNSIIIPDRFFHQPPWPLQTNRQRPQLKFGPKYRGQSDEREQAPKPWWRQGCGGWTTTPGGKYGYLAFQETGNFMKFWHLGWTRFHQVWTHMFLLL